MSAPAPDRESPWPDHLPVRPQQVARPLSAAPAPRRRRDHEGELWIVAIAVAGGGTGGVLQWLGADAIYLAGAVLVALILAQLSRDRLHRVLRQRRKGKR